MLVKILSGVVVDGLPRSKDEVIDCSRQSALRLIATGKAVGYQPPAPTIEPFKIVKRGRK